MPTIRNAAAYDLEVAGRVYPAGEAVDVSPAEAEYLCANPNFRPVEAPDTTDERPTKAGKKD